MQNIIIAKPYEFVPPVRWNVLARGVSALLAALPLQGLGDRAAGRGESRSAAGRRSRPGEHACITAEPLSPVRPDGGRRARGGGRIADLHDGELASVHGQPVPGLAPEADGAFSIYREGLDRTAVKAAIDLLAEARRPLVIFPEGIISRGNDRLAALNEGPAFIARSAAKLSGQVRTGESNAPVVRSRCGTAFSAGSRRPWPRSSTGSRRDSPGRPGPTCRLIERLRQAGNAILGLKELELVGGFREGGIHERLERLIDDILGPLEDRVEGEEAGERRAVAGACPPRRDPPGARGRQLDRRRPREPLETARAALPGAAALASTPAGYLAGSPSTERILETVERLEEDLTDVATVHRPLAVTIHVGEPIEVERSRSVAGGAHGRGTNPDRGHAGDRRPASAPRQGRDAARDGRSHMTEADCSAAADRPGRGRSCCASSAVAASLGSGSGPSR